MGRVPSYMLTHQLGVELVEGTNARGDVFGDLFTIPAHAEDSSELVVDERTTSPTAGTEVMANVYGIVQLDRRIEPGTRITWQGKAHIVVRRKHLEHRAAPSHTELWGV